MALLRRNAAQPDMDFPSQMMNNTQPMINPIYNLTDMQPSALLPQETMPMMQYSAVANTQDEFGRDSYGRNVEYDSSMDRTSRRDSNSRDDGMKRGQDWDASQRSDGGSRYDKRRRRSSSSERQPSTFFGRPLARRDNRDDRRESSLDRSSKWDRSRDRSPDRGYDDSGSGRRERDKSIAARRDEGGVNLNNWGTQNVQQNWVALQQQQLQQLQQMGNAALMGQNMLGQNMMGQNMLGQNMMAAGMNLGLNPAMASANNILSNLNPSLLPPMAASNTGLLGNGPSNSALQPTIGPQVYPEQTMAGSVGMDTQGSSQQGTLPITAYTRPNCSLEPPPPDMPMQKQKEKPEGCRTVFIGGLPESINEHIINEIFYVCGEITSIRISKGKGENARKFCHLRFGAKESVDTAVLFSGYRLYTRGENMAIESSRIFVDYAASRDDQQDYERELRAQAREERHRYREEMEKIRLVEEETEKKVKFFTDHAASELLHNLRNEQGSFYESFSTLTQWLERGEVTRKTVATFYALLNCIHNHIKRLVKEKKENEEIVERQKLEQYWRAKKVRDQGETILTVFNAACQKKCWDHFSKAQRRNISDWQKQVMEEMKLIEESEQPVKQDSVGMDLDEDSQGQPEESIKDQVESQTLETTVTAAAKGDQTANQTEVGAKAAFDPEDAKARAQAAGLKALAEKNTSLMWEVESYKNEMELLRDKYAAVFDEKDSQIARLTVALQGLQQYLQNAVLKPPQIKSSNIEVVVTKEEAKEDIETADMEIEGKAKEPADENIDTIDMETEMEPAEVEKADEVEVGKADEVEVGKADEVEVGKADEEEEGAAEPEGVADEQPAEEAKEKSKPAGRRASRRGKKQATQVEESQEDKTDAEKEKKKPKAKRGATKKKEEKEQKSEEEEDQAKSSSQEENVGESQEESAAKNQDEVVPDADEGGPDDKAPVTPKASDDTTQKPPVDTPSGTEAKQLDLPHPIQLVRLSENEMALVGVLCSFLSACPSGASAQQITAHVQRHVPGANQETVDKALTSLPMLFEQESEPVGQAWRFCGFTVGKQ
ncbi:FK506-binding protein 5 isoform X2 [Nematostella vectensis]|uniref:FK506-binding protein 5 isoform X2 n=1 Tax=Nematostella vectensis TaxID=45351 RepID=UPI002076ECAC|nr:FK506-binding protein 5 isoform X2 [Nematostella vectensis]